MPDGQVCQSLSIGVMAISQATILNGYSGKPRPSSLVAISSCSGACCPSDSVASCACLLLHVAIYSTVQGGCDSCMPVSVHALLACTAHLLEAYTLT